MEIERRFIVAAFPEDLEVLRRAEVKQGYISTGEPEARIRWTKDEHKTTYKLGFKTDGTLVSVTITNNFNSKIEYHNHYLFQHRKRF